MGLLTVLAWLSPAALADTSDFGVTGLIDTPTARMMEDGQIRVSYSTQDIVAIYAINYQPLPWLEASFRYSIFNPYRVPGANDERRDRSFEIKAKLLEETETRPALVFGVKDLVGTGVFGAEYFAASKQVGPLDLSLGIGWGRLAERGAFENPLRQLSESFAERDADVSVEQSGRFRLSNYLSSPDAGLFGGVRYRLPRWNTNLVAEYNSDRYNREVGRNTVSETSPWSFGVEWEPVQDIELAFSWQQGNQFGFRLGVDLDTVGDVARKPPNGFGARGVQLRRNLVFRSETPWYDYLVADAQASGLLLQSAHPVDEQTLVIEYSNYQYQLEADAIARVLTLAETYVPGQYRRLILTGRFSEYRTHSVLFVRDGLERWASASTLPDELRRPTVMPPLVIADPQYKTRYRFPNLSLTPNIGLRPYIFDPDSPFRAQVFLRLTADADFGRGYTVSASYIQNLYSQFDGIRRGSNSVLPRVRSELVRYLQDGESGIDRLVAMKRGNLRDDVHYIAFGGLLEEQYGGVGAEVLYRPFGSRIGVGVNAMWVRQRDFDKGLGFRDYETVIGHVSGYWATPFYNFDVAVHAGRYLARDIGATVEVKRRFANGWEVGAFATLTDVPFEEFGEGSFDKGLYFSVPFNPFLGRNTRGGYRTILRAVQRDGGARIENWDSTLWDSLRHTHYDDLERYENRMMP